MPRSNDVVIKPQEEYAYGHIIKALAGGLYPNKFHVAREYVQNGFDAILNWKQTKKHAKCQIRISIQKPSIFIYDNGTGMDRHTLNEYRKVGFSKKMVGEFAGFRGIGKLAGISVAKKLIVTTSPYGISEKYILTFDAEAMINEIDALKKNRENISLNNLIAKHTTISSDAEHKNEHYTMVELHDIKPDSKILLDNKNLCDYLSKNAPVPFDPNFPYGKEIEDDIRRFVLDYDCVELLVDNMPVYKPFAPNLKPYKHILVWDSKRQKQKAFCWYCENIGKGQIKSDELSGFIYRYKNFAVGDNYLTRKTIWGVSSHLAFYFMGEIYITVPEIIPTSQRDDFEQSIERDTFYKDANVIANEVIKLARTSSNIRRAKEVVDEGAKVVSTIGKEVDKKEPSLRDLSVEKITLLSNTISKIQSREKNIPPDDKSTRILAKRVVKKAWKLLGQISEIEKQEKKQYSIINALRFNNQAKRVYLTTIRTLKDVLVDQPEELEVIIKEIHKNLKKEFGI